MALDIVVRPYLIRNISPPQRVRRAAEKVTAPLMLTIGKSGRGKQMSGSASLSITYYSEKAHVERRET